MFLEKHTTLTSRITKDDYPLKDIQDLKEGDIFIVVGFRKKNSEPILENIYDFQDYQVNRDTKFFTTIKEVCLEIEKTYQVKKVGQEERKSLVQVTLLMTG